VKASEKVNRFLLLSGKTDAVWKKFGVTGAPTLIFVDPAGKKVGTGTRDSAGLIKSFNEISEKYGRAPKWAENEETALKAAKEEQKPLVVYYRDDKQKSEQALSEFSVQPLAEFYDKAVWVQKTLDVKSDEAKALGISAVPAVWIIDARLDDAKARVLKKSSPKGATIKTDLEAILKAWKKMEPTKEEPKKD
jgi:hypothetical protein